MRNTIIPPEVLAACPEGARVIPLTRGRFTFVDAEDYDELNAYKWAWNANSPSGYAVRSIRIPGTKKTRGQSMHRLLMGNPDGMLVDHINGNTLDNRRSNLRLATHADNSRNQRVNSKNTSGLRGVFYYAKYRVWRAQITVNHKFIYLGNYQTKEEAAEAYAAAALLYHGEFARLK